MIHVYVKNCEKSCTAVNILFNATYLSVENNIFLISSTVSMNSYYKNVQKNAFECCKLNSKHTINLNCTNKYTRQRVLKFGLDSIIQCHYLR